MEAIIDALLGVDVEAAQQAVAALGDVDVVAYAAIMPTLQSVIQTEHAKRRAVLEEKRRNEDQLAERQALRDTKAKRGKK